VPALAAGTSRLDAQLVLFENGHQVAFRYSNACFFDESVSTGLVSPDGRSVRGLIGPSARRPSPTANLVFTPHAAQQDSSITVVGLSQPAVLVGEPFYADLRVENLSSVPSPATTLEARLSADEQVDAADPFAGAPLNIPRSLRVPRFNSATTSRPPAPMVPLLGGASA
jgi:hypothetical protein